jgi:integrase
MIVKIIKKERLSMKFNKLNRVNMRALPAGKSLSEGGIKYTKLSNGDGRFEVELMVNKQRIHRTVGKESEGVTREQCEQLIAKLKTEAREKRLKLPKRRKLAMGFEEAAALYLTRTQESGGKSLEVKKKALKNHLTPYFSQKPLSEISTFDVERLKKYLLDKGLKRSSINRYISVLSHLLSSAIEWGWLDHKPCTIKPYPDAPGRVTYLTHEQCAALLAAAKTNPNPQLYPFIRIGLDTGMRTGEILSIRLDNIDFDRLEIYLPETKTGPRHQPISQSLATYLLEYTASLPAGTEWLFPSQQLNAKSPYTRRIEESFRSAVKAAGMDPYKVVRHTLRHTVVTLLKQAGVDDSTVMKITGHKTTKMLLRYSHTNRARVQDAIDHLAQLHQNYTNPSEGQQSATAKLTVHEGFAYDKIKDSCPRSSVG